MRVPRTRETVMLVRVRSALELRREDSAAIAEVAAGLGRGVTDRVVSVTVEM